MIFCSGWSAWKPRSPDELIRQPGRSFRTEATGRKRRHRRRGERAGNGGEASPQHCWRGSWLGRGAQGAKGKPPKAKGREAMRVQSITSFHYSSCLAQISKTLSWAHRVIGKGSSVTEHLRRDSDVDLASETSHPRTPCTGSAWSGIWPASCGGRLTFSTFAEPARLPSCRCWAQKPRFSSTKSSPSRAGSGPKFPPNNR